MPIVFVHGVNTRRDASYEAGNLLRQTFLRTHLEGARINGKTLAVGDVLFPYWGDLATTFAWNMASLPRDDMEALGGTADESIQALVAHIRDALPGAVGPEPLLALARKSFPQAVDVVIRLALGNVPPGEEQEFAAFAATASAHADANPAPAWVAPLVNDSQFVNQLLAEVSAAPATQALGGLGSVANKIALAALKLKQAVTGIAGKAVDRAGDFASTKLLAWSRESLNAVMGRFFGDIFIYFDGRGDRNHPGPIPQVILKAFSDAAAATPAGEPLVIVGHSLGGVISFDLLGHFCPDLQVDLFVSIGSQVAHFEELKLYRNSDRAIRAPARARTPVNIRRWINVYDEVDIFAYAAERVFDRVDVDGRYDTQTYVIKAHGAYFEQNRFYERLRARIDALP